MTTDLSTTGQPAGTPEVTWPLILDVLAALEAHGIQKADNNHVGQAVGMIGQLARVYSGRAEW